MYTIRVKGEFSAAHNLREYEGKCENLHGHNWKVEAEIASHKLNKTGMVLDFKEARAPLKKILEKLDHKYINDLAYFKEHNPTSENIAKYIYEALDKKVDGLNKVTVRETDATSASYAKK